MGGIRFRCYSEILERSMAHAGRVWDANTGKELLILSAEQKGHKNLCRL
jgi:hypothetical protein